MTNDSVLCPGCGITLRPFMKQCPRCGAVREVSADAPPPPPVPPRLRRPRPGLFTSTPEKTLIVPIGPPQPQSPPPRVNVPVAPPTIDPIVLFPPADETGRFPLFTGAQLKLIAAGGGLLIFALLIGRLLWSREQQDQVRPTGDASLAPPPAANRPIPSFNSLPGASPGALPNGDQALAEAVKSALTAHNPSGSAQYRFAVRDGVVTLAGEATDQAEKDGAGNILRLIFGVKGVVNNVQIKAAAATIAPPKLELPDVKPGQLRPLAAASSPRVQANPQTDIQTPPPPQPPPAQPAPAQTAQLSDEPQPVISLQPRDGAEAQAREVGEAERRREAERRARTESAKPDAALLQAGTFAWSGVVDGVDEVIIAGGGASVRHVGGQAPREVRSSFSAPLPRAPVGVKLASANGRGSISVQQQPSAANGYTAIVRLDDAGHEGGARYEFTLRWSVR